MQDLISIIVPVYNASNTVEKTIQSILKQSYTHFEVIVIDDCSSDNSFEILEALEKIDKRIILYKNEKNLGVSQTRNYGISKAKGEFIAFLDSDDEWRENKLELQLQYIKKQQADLCYTAYEMVGEKDSLGVYCSVPAQVTYKELLKENSILCSSVLVRKSRLKEMPFNSEFFHEDFVLWLELLKEGCKAVGFQESLVRYQKGGRSADKLQASKNRWIIYRKCEQLGRLGAVYYFFHYMINGIKKYYVKTNSSKEIST
ncbi:glycosyl transferase family 2 [Sporanaerobium hydrogeniformans]|uniref:Glycosyl transferase family 2 n=1 Tax=Sporanaerobium hydrogeniformans TaxID=3072179 RepID=A0AC61DA47_9FIRM|nr:glycosyltransferase family A protein [Sporanaerobium hydrogeniformans]PHV70159.1 glycosyl transferase family 2 [Sporanaerobium hydrogeniformans]